MNDLTIGFIISVIGILVTIITLYILMLIIRLLSKLFPYREQVEEKK